MSAPVILFDNRFADTTVLTASTTDPNDTTLNVANIIDMRPYTFWGTDTSTSTGIPTLDKFIEIDTNNTAARANALAIVGHNLFTAGSTIEISGGTASSVLAGLGSYAPNSDKAFMIDVSSVTPYRFWHLTFQQPTTIKIRIGAVVLGEKLTFERALPKEINPEAHKVISEGVDSKTLHPLGIAERGRMREADINLNGLSATFISDQFLPAWDEHLGGSKPFFWHWNTESDSNVRATSVRYMQVEPNSAFMSNYHEATEFRNLRMKLKGRKE